MNADMTDRWPTCAICGETKPPEQTIGTTEGDVVCVDFCQPPDEDSGRPPSIGQRNAHKRALLELNRPSKIAEELLR